MPYYDYISWDSDDGEETPLDTGAYRPYDAKLRVYITSNSSIDNICGVAANTSAWAQNPPGAPDIVNFSDITTSTRLFESDGSPLANGFYGIRPKTTLFISDLPSTHKVKMTTNNGIKMIHSIVSCTLVILDPIDDTPKDPVVENPPVTPPTSNIEYCYYTILNDSYSRKIFGYYSGSSDFEYNMTKTTGSGESGPNAGFIRLDSGSLGSGGNTDEVDSKFLYIDVKDSGSQEDIVSYLTQLETLDPAYKGRVRLEVKNSSSYFLDFDINGITANSIPGNGYFEVGLLNGQSQPDNNPFSASLAWANLPTGSSREINVRFFNDALLGYHEIELNGSSSVSFIAAKEQTNPALPSGSIPEPFNTSWGISEAEFLSEDYYPTSRGNAWMWNDGYKVKHIKMNNISSGGDKISIHTKKSEDSTFVLYNPKDSHKQFIHPGSGNYAEGYVLSNVTKFPNYDYLFIDQLNNETSFAVTSENFAQTDFNLSVDGRYIIYATSSGTVTHPTASEGINKSIPQGYFPATLNTEQYFRGWDNANYYLNGNLVSTQGDINDPLEGFNSGSTERDKDDLGIYEASQLPFFINASSSFVTVQSESILQYTEGLNNLTQIGPTFQVVGGGEQKYLLKEDTGIVYISGSENLDLKKTNNPLFNTTHDVEVVPVSNEVVYYDTGEGFEIEVKPSQSLWLSRGIATPGTGDGDNWKYNRFLHRPYKTYALTSTGSYITGYSEELYGDGIYGEGPYPVGPPPNEFETIYIAYSESSANLRNDGVYTFNTALTEDIIIYADVELDYQRNSSLTRAKYGEAEFGSEEYGQEDTDPINTWDDVTLKLYKNNSLLASHVINNVSSNIAEGITLEVTRSIAAGGMDAGDTLKLSLEVDNAQANFNAAIITPQYNLRIDAPEPPTSDLVPVTFANSLGRTDDCNPMLNNLIGDKNLRPNPRLQNIDYSVDINSPINFDQIIKNEAIRATVPESNFTQLGFANQRYYGSSTTREKINEYNDQSIYDQENKFYYQGDISDPDNFNRGKGPKLGKVPNVELKNSYISYFSKVIDPYPLVNGKTAYYVKYLIDESGTIFDPALSDNNFSLFEKTYQLQDYDLEPTRVKTSIQNIEGVKEISKLNDGFSSTFKLGKYPVPILYSQTSSLGHTNNIILSGSPFFGTLGIGSTFTNYGLRSSTSQTAYPEPSSRTSHTDLSPETFGTIGDADVILFDGNINTDNITVTSSIVDGAILMPQDNNAEVPNTDGSPLSDNYVINGSYIFYTSTLPALFQNYTPSHWTERRVKALPSLEIDVNFYEKSPTLADTANNYQSSTTNISQNDISLTLTIIVDAGGSDEQEYVVPFPRTPLGYSPQWTFRSGQGVRITPHSLAIEDAIANAVFNGESTKKNSPLRSKSLFKELVAGGWGDDDGDGNINGGYGTKVVHYKWTLNYTVKNLKQGSGFRSAGDGRFISNAKGKSESQYKYFKWYSNDLFMMYKGSTSSRDRKSFNSTRTFTPSHITVDTNPVVKYEVTSPLASSDQNNNGAPGPFWRQVPNESNMLYMSSSVLNEAYAVYDNDGNRTNSAYYVQAKLDYTGDINVSFPATQEPDFIEFDPVQDPWSLRIGDEVRFENNESLVFTITSTSNKPAIKNPGDLSSNDISQKLQIHVTPEIPDNINLDFFVVRRYKENRNFIILDQQMPYGFPTTGSLEPASSPGILLPEHRIEKYDRNPDEVLKELIEKRII